MAGSERYEKVSAPAANVEDRRLGRGGPEARRQGRQQWLHCPFPHKPVVAPSFEATVRGRDLMERRPAGHERIVAGTVASRRTGEQQTRSRADRRRVPSGSIVANDLQRATAYTTASSPHTWNNSRDHASPERDQQLVRVQSARTASATACAVRHTRVHRHHESTAR